MRGTFRYILNQSDLPLLGACLCASLYGLVLIASATNWRGMQSFVIVQGAAIVLGVVAYFMFSSLDMEHKIGRAHV